MLTTYNIGYHIGKLKTMYDSMKNIEDIKNPYQIFLGSPTNNKFSIDKDDILKTHAIINEKKINIFVHLPYIFNLATRNEFIVDQIQQYCIVAFKCGFKGCVIHVPKSTKISVDLAYQNTKLNIQEILEKVNVSCPLILETPAGQGTEMFYNKEEFLNFVQNEINDERLKICIDTAHVFSTGYLPSIYLNYILNNSSNLLYLIHFNDSKDCYGSCTDRHECLGKGFIPKDDLLTVAKIANENNIPLIREY